MRYINRLFTYLLTYSLTDATTKDDDDCVLDVSTTQTQLTVGTLVPASTEAPPDNDVSTTQTQLTVPSCQRRPRLLLTTACDRKSQFICRCR